MQRISEFESVHTLPSVILIFQQGLCSPFLSWLRSGLHQTLFPKSSATEDTALRDQRVLHAILGIGHHIDNRLLVNLL